MLTLGQAARLTGTSKTTLTHAIKAGRLSATRRDNGVYAIDPAELARVYAVKVETPATGAATGATVHRTTPERDPGDTLALRVEVEMSDDGPGLSGEEIAPLGPRGRRLDEQCSGTGFGIAREILRAQPKKS